MIAKHRADNEWMPVGYELTDATGNWINNRLWPTLTAKAEVTVTLQPCLWPSECAWKLRMESQIVPCRRLKHAAPTELKRVMWCRPAINVALLAELKLATRGWPTRQ